MERLLEPTGRSLNVLANDNSGSIGVLHRGLRLVGDSSHFPLLGNAHSCPPPAAMKKYPNEAAVRAYLGPDWRLVMMDSWARLNLRQKAYWTLKGEGLWRVIRKIEEQA